MWQREALAAQERALAQQQALVAEVKRLLAEQQALVAQVQAAVVEASAALEAQKTGASKQYMSASCWIIKFDFSRMHIVRVYHESFAWMFSLSNWNKKIIVRVRNNNSARKKRSGWLDRPNGRPIDSRAVSSSGSSARLACARCGVRVPDCPLFCFFWNFFFAFFIPFCKKFLFFVFFANLNNY